MTAKQRVVLAHINAVLSLCKDFITGKDIPLGVNRVMVEKVNAKVQQSIVFHIPAFANENVKTAHTVTHYSLLGRLLL